MSTLLALKPSCTARMRIAVLLVACITTIVGFVAVERFRYTHAVAAPEFVGPTRPTVAILLVTVVILAAIFLAVASVDSVQTHLADGALKVFVGTSFRRFTHRSVCRRFVAVVVTIVGFVARPCLWNTAAIFTSEVKLSVTRSYRRRTAIPLVGSVTTIVFPITFVRFQDTFTVAARKLSLLAFLCWSDNPHHIHNHT